MTDSAQRAKTRFHRVLQTAASAAAATAAAEEKDRRRISGLEGQHRVEESEAAAVPEPDHPQTRGRDDGDADGLPAVCRYPGAAPLPVPKDPRQDLDRWCVRTQSDGSQLRMRYQLWGYGPVKLIMVMGLGGTLEGISPIILFQSSIQSFVSSSSSLL